MNSFTYAIIVVVLIILLVVNAVTFLIWMWDKSCARRGTWRIPERQMLGLALIGGSPAAFYASHRLRHKTRKEPFRTHLKLVVGFQVIAGIALCFPQVRAQLVAIISGL